MQFDQLKRRGFITLLGSALALPLTTRAQERERVRRIGVLMNLAADDPIGQARLSAFGQGLQELGWTDGRNVRIDIRWGAGDADRYRKYAAELVALAPDVMLAASGATMPALMQATRTVPIVFVLVPDPVGSGFVASLARPGGNATGFSLHEFVTGSAPATVHRDLIITLAARHSLPAVYPYRHFPPSGGLISYGPDQTLQYRQAAGYVDRILKGEKPADLPLQAPTKYELVINLKTAKALALTLPPTLLARADEVIE